MDEWRKFLAKVAAVARLEREKPDDIQSIRLAWRALTENKEKEK